MPRALELLRQGRNEELWLKSCGFIDLSIEQFMTIQERLLLEQIELLKRCELGRRVMRGARPGSVEEFRQRVPITVYGDYTPYLPERIEDALPAKPMLWQRTSGRSEEYTFKWVPVTRRMYDELGDIFMAVLIFASCKGRGDIVLEEQDRFLYAMAPPPYASGCWAHRAAEENIFEFLPSLGVAETMEFEERLSEGFKLAVFEGMDLLFALTGLLIAIGERFGEEGGLSKAIPLLRKPKALARMLKAVARSRLAGRPILPRDIWSLKMLVGFGTDNVIFKEKIKEMWGRYPLDVYGATETVMIAMQTWDYSSMTFIPHINFLEFVPEEQYRRFATDRSFTPDAYLLNEVKPGENYGLVITNFYGGAYARYFMGDVVTIVSARNESLGIDIPQMKFHSRVDNVIDIEGCAQFLTEATMWRAIEDSGVGYRDWVVRLESRDSPVIHYYVEPRNGVQMDNDLAAKAIREQLGKLHSFYHTLESIRNVTLQVTPVPVGAFEAYMAKQRAAGADLAHLKPPHVNPNDSMVEFLLNGAK